MDFGSEDESDIEFEEDDDSGLIQLDVANRLRLVLWVVACVGSFYKLNFLTKEPCRTSPRTGWNFVCELLNGNPRRCEEQLRMHKDVFLPFCALLQNNYNLKHTRHTRVEEMVAMFLIILGHGVGNRMVQEIFQHSGATIHKHFHRVLQSVVWMSMDWIKPSTDNMNTIHPYIFTNPKYYPFFKGCIGAIDGTHIRAAIPHPDNIPYIGRKGYASQNIMAVCDFDMCFIFAWPGWEGSVHDARIFLQAIRDETMNFPLPRDGEFYLVDAGYPNMKGYLAPYNNQRYHLQEFRQGPLPQNAQEKFNQTHSSLRCVIERTFGVWKERWHILYHMPSYEFKHQVDIVCASMAIHNFIRKTAITDQKFEMYDSNPEYVPCEDDNTRDRASNHLIEDNDDATMGELRDQICYNICHNIRD